jgi:hypothetical protein
MSKVCALFLFLFLRTIIYSDPYTSQNLIADLLLVQEINEKVYDIMPVTHNLLLQGGYIAMPSARVNSEGNCAFGYAFLPPYSIYSARLQCTPYLEVTGSYRLFRGIPDLQLSAYGFGDFSDKGVNFKVVLLHPEDSDYELPGLAFGMDDFLGTRAFRSSYVVLTKVWNQLNLEVSLGYGEERLNGFFAGALWMPFRKSLNKALEGVTLLAEYDATDYKNKKREPHPKGRQQFSPLNFGAQWKVYNVLEASINYVRGYAWAFSGSFQCDFGKEEGLFPKMHEPPLYQLPTHYAPIFSEELLKAFQEQGYKLLEVERTHDVHCHEVLKIRIKNCCWRTQKDQFCRIAHVLASLVPKEIELVVVIFDCIGMDIQEISFPMPIVRQWFNSFLSTYEMQILSPLKDVGSKVCLEEPSFFHQDRLLCDVDIAPKIITFFGSATGKFKYLVGVNLGLSGFLKDRIYYSLLIGYSGYTTLHDVGDIDKINPSQIINVRTDYVNYIRDEKFYIDEAFLQKNISFGGGHFAMISGGLFEVMYGGLAAEWLYYPVNLPFAVGLEMAYLKKRTYDGFGFTNTMRKCDGFIPTYVHFNGYQYFADFYYTSSALDLDFKIKVGKFLAHDFGARYEINKYFSSGLEVYLWYTRTNGHDVVNRQIYYDKGVGFSLPLDFFLTKSCYRRFGYGMSAWLRDVGAIASTGVPLYRTIGYER